MINGKELKRLRVQRGLTQQEVGDAIGLSKQTVGKYENGRLKEMLSTKIEIIAALYGVSPAYIMGWEKTPPATELSDAEKSHIMNLRSMDAKIKDEIISRTESASKLFPPKDATTPKRATS